MKTKLSALLLAVATTAMAQNPNPIRVNQVGYATTASKTAAIEENGWAKKYTLTDAATGTCVWKGKAQRTAESPWSGKKRAIIDFSEVKTPGTYIGILYDLYNGMSDVRGIQRTPTGCLTTRWALVYRFDLWVTSRGTSCRP